MRIFQIFDALFLITLISVHISWQIDQDLIENQKENNIEQNDNDYQNNASINDLDDFSNEDDFDEADQYYQENEESSDISDEEISLSPTGMVFDPQQHKEEFDEIDLNKAFYFFYLYQDGRLDIDEIRKNVEGATEKELNDLMIDADTDYTGTLDFEEYLAIAKDVHENHDEEQERMEELIEKATERDEEMERFYEANKHLFGDRKKDL